MTDTYTNPFKSFFFANDPNDPNISADMRKRIALQMLMSNKRPYPKTLGEGLAAIGGALADQGAIQQLGAIDAAENAAGDALLKKYTDPQAGAAYAAPPAAPSIVPAPPPQARTIAPAAAPSGGATPVPAGPGGVVEPGDFNEIDAADPRNRYQPGPAYLQGALERNIADPERRAYLGQLAGKEAQSAGEVSPTGAAGPFQFTRGTGAQYGIPGKARFDPDASTLAANRFTDDNVRTLTARLGREPTPREMALAHQQGAVTAARMLAGTGNAPAKNLEANNVPPGMGPQAAAQKVMGYYGMPASAGGSPAPVLAQGDAAASDQQLALAAPQQPAPDFGIRSAPPAAPIRQAPSTQQVAQAGPQPGHVLTLGPPPTPPPTMTPLQQRIMQDINAEPPFTRETVKKKLQPIWEQEQAKLAQAQAAHVEAVKQWHERAKTQQDQIEKSAKAKQDYAVQQQVLEKGKSPDRVVHEGQILERQKDGSWKNVTPGASDPDGKPAFKGTEFQGKALVNYGRAQLAQDVLTPEKEKLLATSPLQSALGRVGVRAFQDDDYKEADTARENFVQAFIRQQSGGAYTAAELEKEARAMLPEYRDTEQVLQDKRSQRDAFTKSLRSALGSTSNQQIADQQIAEERAAVAARKAARAASKIEENTTATGPNGEKIIRRNGKWEPM